MKPARPLDRFSLVNTSNLDETLAALTQIYAKPLLQLVDRGQALHARLNHCQLRYIGLSYGSYAADIHMRFPETNFASQIFSIAGKSEAEIDGASISISSNCSVVISPGEALRVTNDAEYERLVLTIDSTALADKLSAITGVICGEPLKFSPLQNSEASAAKTLRNHFLFLVDKLNASTLPIPNVVLAEFEQTIMVMFLYANRHNYSYLFERPASDVAHWQLCRAKEYIEANWRRAITLEELAKVAGVSAFSLFRSFRKSHGVSPMDFARKVRLCRARELLQRPDAATSVADVAATCGFGDVGQFADDYVQSFGEHPSQTLGRGEGNGADAAPY